MLVLKKDKTPVETAFNDKLLYNFHYYFSQILEKRTVALSFSEVNLIYLLVTMSKNISWRLNKFLINSRNITNKELLNYANKVSNTFAAKI